MTLLLDATEVSETGDCRHLYPQGLSHTLSGVESRYKVTIVQKQKGQ